MARRADADGSGTAAGRDGTAPILVPCAFLLNPKGIESFSPGLADSERPTLGARLELINPERVESRHLAYPQSIALKTSRNLRPIQSLKPCFSIVLFSLLRKNSQVPVHEQLAQITGFFRSRIIVPNRAQSCLIVPNRAILLNSNDPKSITSHTLPFQS